MITIVDYGIGNLGSMANMLKKIGVPCRISANSDDILVAEKLILPGIGSFDQGIQSLRERALIEPLNRRVMYDRIPLLGVCLGMQLLGRSSEEGSSVGLGWIPAHSVCFRNTPGFRAVRVPHMGWNIARSVRADPIFAGLEETARFYFVHSYHVICDDPADVVATTPYGSDFISILRHGNVWGAQFHPEKSHRFGMQLLRNFAAVT